MHRFTFCLSTELGLTLRGVELHELPYTNRSRLLLHVFRSHKLQLSSFP